ncbi:unnamed protein product [Rotaria sordida]|uniref:Uncharacterized protein n=1 Tax=Rotaria sordida TaxID=392033 RepID=A0A818TGT6_9BILA|nr:unnamed protein product [Rotaria sordida]CAF3998406.1 unnamed protein product [Rotaria sordida]
MDKAVHDLYKQTNDDQQKVIAPNDGSLTSTPTIIETVDQHPIGQQATKPVTQADAEAIVENEKRQTDIKTVSDDARTGATKTNMQPPDTTTLEGTIANEANPNTNPR